MSTLLSQSNNEYNIDNIFENGDLLYFKNSKKKVDGKVYKKINNKLMIMGLVKKERGMVYGRCILKMEKF